MNIAENHITSVLYLIPNFISDTLWEDNFPDSNKEIICNLKYFIAESAKSCRQMLRHAGYKDISAANITEYNEHHFNIDVSDMLKPLEMGYSVGLISDAGAPVIADPGDVIVQMAHQKKIRVIPLIGPSAIMLSIMASGLSGNNFAFNGYLPHDPYQKIKKIKELENISFQRKQAQFFIETPYRNQKMLEVLLNTLHSHTLVSLCCNIQSEDFFARTQIVLEWKKEKNIDIAKKPCVFGLMKM